MSTVKSFCALLVFLLLYSCGGGKTAVPSNPDFVIPRAPKKFLISEPVPAKHLREAIENINNGKGDGALTILRQVTEQYRHTPWYKRALFLTERALIKMDLPEEATAAMLRVQTEYPELSDYAVFILAEYHVAQERYSQAAALYQTIGERYPKSLLTSRSLFQQAQALLESKAFPQAEEVFRQFLEDNPSSEFAPAAGFGLGMALQQQGRLDEAVKAYQDVWVKYAGSLYDRDAEQSLSELRSKKVKVPELSTDEMYGRGKNLYRSRQYDKAKDVFTKLIGKNNDFSNRSEAMLMTGISLYYIGRRADAAALLERMVKQYPTDSHVPEALNWIGKSYSKLGEWERGVKTFQKILNQYSESEWADDALFLSGNIYRETNETKKSLAYYARLAEEYPQSRFADSAIWWQAWSQYSAGDYRKSIQTLQELVRRYPRSFLVNQARYWQGKAMEKLGDIPKAGAYYQRVLAKGPFTFYGYLASERVASLGASDASIEPDSIPSESSVLCKETTCPDDPMHSSDVDDGPPVWTEETRALLAADPLFKKTLELMYVDMKKEAAAELWSLQERPRKKRGALIGLSKAFFELGDYHRSHMLVLRKYERYLEAPRDGVTEDLWFLAYPQAFWDQIVFYARKYRQDPYFIAAIMREESQFKTEALSPAGARGLLQVMPSTGAQVARQIKMKGFNSNKLYDAATVINIGTWYVGQLMKRFKGDPLFAAAAYNAGPEAVASWIRKNGAGRDRDVFVESIPYMETRGYVKKVLRNYAEYKRIYGRYGETIPFTPTLPVDAAEIAATETVQKQ